MKRAFFVLMVLFITASLLQANAPFQGGLKNKPMTVEAVFGADDDYPIFDYCHPPNSPLNSDDPVDPVGQIIIVGSTWYDIQHNASCGRQIQVDSENYVHISYMRGNEAGTINRHIYYQWISPARFSG